MIRRGPRNQRFVTLVSRHVFVKEARVLSAVVRRHLHHSATSLSCAVRCFLVLLPLLAVRAAAAASPTAVPPPAAARAGPAVRRGAASRPSAPRAPARARRHRRRR